MSKTLILGASGGIGSALAAACAAKGEEVLHLSRSVDGFDITDEASVARHLGALEGPFRRVVVATGALEIDGAEPEKTIKAIEAKAMMDQFALNAVGPALVLSHAHDLLPREGRSVFAVLSARVGSIGDNKIGGWISYRSAKAAVNQVVHTASIELKRTHKEAVCVALHPGTVATAFTEKYLGRHPAVQPEEAARNLLAVMDGLSVCQTGQFFDWAGKEVPW
ncbi:SDR family NAD(P)-dependent oxidoreductase [Marimonas sp. MJW-29]|uniref:SDR family NAD(P)-dependent oxidoreductase n=1 Tax=Sulfitobacter sediminis TaxID=3234186 RepID=A0ABV3RRN0_9RHOB